MGWRIRSAEELAARVLFANKEFMRFRTRIQAVNELQNRPAGLGKRARMKEAGGEKVATASGGRMASAYRRQPPLLRHRLLDAWVALHLQQRTVKTNRRSRSQKSNTKSKNNKETNT